jgi:general secretion pathway protein G
MLVVLAIIATLASVVGPAVFRNTGDAKIQAARSQIETLGLALEAYRLDNDEYPTAEQGLGSLWEQPTVGDAPKNWRGPYVRRVIPNDPWGRPYVYIVPGRQNVATFDLYSLGRDGKIGGVGEDGDVTSWGSEVRQ